MLKNYFKIAWRNFRKNKFFSFVNIFGLAVGLTCCMLITIYLYHEFTYDQYFKNSKRIYKIGTTFLNGDISGSKTLTTPAPMGPALQREYPEIEMMTRTLSLFSDDKTLFQYTDEKNTVKPFYEKDGYMADSTFFRVFEYAFTEGNANVALDEPNAIVLSAEIAKKMFGNQPAINKIIHINSSFNGAGDYKVTGVFSPSEHPTHIDARFFLSMSSGQMGSFVKQATDFAGNNMFNTYLLLRPGNNGAALEKKLPAFVEKYMQKDLRAAGFGKRQFLVPVKDLHLFTGVSFGQKAGGTNRTYLYILASVALFILVIACINFMNLATARSAKRAAEVGIRKVLGAEKGALIRQFLGESLLLAFISFLLALILVQVFLPLFSRISGVNLTFNFAQQVLMLAAFVALTMVTGLVAGSYPALYLSAFKPIKVLKGRFSNSLSAITFRKALVVFQFTISAALIIAAFAIGKQMKFMRTTDLGFAKDQQIVIPLRSENAKKIYNDLKNELVKNPQILSAGASMYYPGIMNLSDFKLFTPDKSVNEGVRVRANWTDQSFLQTLEIKPLAGRLFSEQFPADTNYRMIMNEIAIKKLGFQTAQNAIGKQVIFNWQGESYKFEIIGVVKDFNYEGLKEPIEPYCFQAGTGGYNYLVAHARPDNLQQVLRFAEKEWLKLNPTEPFEYSFLDQDFQKNYDAENRLASLIQYFMVIAITICCLGLFGLAAFSAEQRTKEIGIRKVLGSSVTGIVGLLSKDFMKLVLIGNLLALPVAWYMMHKWLQEFAFRTPLSWWVFAAAIVLSAIIALLTVSYQAIRSALTNPVQSLRTE